MPSEKFKPQLESYFIESKRDIDEPALDLIKKLLCLNPANRITIQEALNHRYFTSEPLPCTQSEMPKIGGDIHEFSVRKQLE